MSLALRAIKHLLWCRVRSGWRTNWQGDLILKLKRYSRICPDGKLRSVINKPYRIHSIGALQNSPSTPDLKQFQDDIRETVINSVFQDEEIRPDEKTRIFINPDGPVIIGGPSVHSGVTGRKNDVDTYGEYSKHSGSALSGKDPIG